LTRLLYYEDSSLREFEGTVQEVADRDGAIWVELDRTAFYPGGGGQPPDRGRLGDVPVTDVREEEGRLWHRIEGKLEARTPIRGALDWRRRFDQNRDKIRALYDERFCRMWEMYLVGAEIAFRRDGALVFQMQLAKAVDSVPLTRDYITDWERARGSTARRREGRAA